MNTVRTVEALGSDDSAMTPDPTRRRIALFGMFGAGNLGNECTLQAMLHNQRRFLPNAQVCCICEGPDDTRLTHNVRAFRIRETPLPPIKNQLLQFLRKICLRPLVEIYRWLNAIKRLHGAEMLVMTGTGMLSDVGILPFGLHYDILRWSIAAKICRCKVMFVCVGVGPIRRPLSRFFVRTALTLADYRSYRDSFSKSYVEKMGGPSEGDFVYPDLAFSLPRNAASHSRTREGEKPVVGIGLITEDKRRATLAEAKTVYNEYITKVAVFVIWLIEKQYTVRLLIGDVAYDGRARQDLRTLLERNGVKYEGQIIDEPAGSVDELLSQLEKTDIVVASRFHNVLLALMLRKPVVAISFHEKVVSLMSAMDLASFCQDIEQVDVNKLIDQFTALEQNAEAYRHDLERRSAGNRRSLEKQYEHIFKTVWNGASNRKLKDEDRELIERGADYAPPPVT
jgi:polysaccharide pyruvyl transferase WcaK-like protein